jgi:hypothetical protein
VHTGYGRLTSAQASRRCWPGLLGRPVPTLQTSQGVRATINGQLIDPARVRRYLERAFGRALAAVQGALEALAQAYPRDQLAARAHPPYEQLRPAVPEGTKGWGAKGDLSLDAIRALVDEVHMSSKKTRVDLGSQDRLIAEARRHQAQQEKTYRGQALKM